MQSIQTVSENTIYVGASDRRLAKFENLFPIPRGVSYNAYVILDEKTALLDTADASVGAQFLENVAAALDGRKLDYLIVDHMEPDHAAMIEAELVRWPDLRLVVNAKTLPMLKMYFPTDSAAIDDALVVKEGDTLDLGKHKLTFVMAPMVHWPEVMMTFDTTTGTLFSADAFGTFGALEGALFADEVDFAGKWLDDAKHETNLPDTFEESGAVPPERDRRETISEEILEMILAGASNAEILMQHPGAMNRLHHIEAARQTLFADKYADAWRDLDVTYLWGKTGVGKTRTIMERYGYKNVYRVTDYDHPFDDYKGEKVVLFEEFRSSLKIADMLKYLDGYPLMLPCRYGNKAAGFDKVYIVSNIPLSQQYPNTQLSEQETYKAFLRRIDREYEMLESSDDDPL